MAEAGVVPWPADATEADWDAMYREQMPRVYNFFRYRLGDGEAEDLTSVTFVKAWGGRQRYRRDLASFPTWLFAIAFLGGWVEQIATLKNQSARYVRTVASLLLPTEALWQRAAYLMRPSLMRDLTMTPFTPASVPRGAMGGRASTWLPCWGSPCSPTRGASSS